nr:transposase [Posidoniimonas corsicana]
MTEVACWAHARRKFYDAQDSDEQRTAKMLSMIAELCAVGREAKDADGRHPGRLENLAMAIICYPIASEAQTIG